MSFKIRRLVGILFLLAGSAKGQFLAFTQPGGPDGRPETIQDRLDREIEEAPYRIGPLYVTPIGGFRDAAYVRDLVGNREDTPPDVTVTVGAGFRTHLRTGRKVTWIAQAVPEYVWWNKRKDSRNLNFSGGIEGIFLLNRLTIDAAASRVEQQRLTTPEIPTLFNNATDIARIDAELELTSRLRPFLSVRLARQEALADDLDDPTLQQIELLDRDEEVERLGLHWYPREGWMFGLGAERSKATFDRATRDASNEGTAPVVEVRINRPHLLFVADLAARSLRATEGSRFVDFDGVTGRLTVSYVPRRRLELWAYSSRDLVYSLEGNYPYMVDRRLGVALSVGVGREERTSGRIFYETGAEDYTAFSPAVPQRTDDLVSFGGSLRFLLVRGLSLTLQASRIDLDSNLPGADRSYTSGGLSLALGGSLAKSNL